MFTIHNFIINPSLLCSDHNLLTANFLTPTTDIFFYLSEMPDPLDPFSPSPLGLSFLLIELRFHDTSVIYWVKFLPVTETLFHPWGRDGWDRLTSSRSLITSFKEDFNTTYHSLPAHLGLLYALQTYDSAS